MPKNSFSDLIAAAYTPLKPNYQLDIDKIQKLVQFYKYNGITGVFLCGTTGEGKLLSLEERKRVLEIWSQLSTGLKIIVQVGCESIVESQLLAEHAQSQKVDGIACISPAMYKPADMQSLLGFCKEVATAAPNMPFYYYHIPCATGLKFFMIDMIKLFSEEIPTFAGMKFSHDDMMDFMQCLRYQDEKYNIFFGKDEFLLAALSMGCTQVVGSTYNYAAPIYRNIIQAFEQNKFDEARLWQSHSHTIVQIIRQYHELAAGKALMKILGVDCGPTRLPVQPLSQQEEKDLEQKLKNAEVFQHLCQLPEG